MTMVKAHVSARELVAGRYLPLEVVHRETNRVVWYADDAVTGRPRLLTRVGLPDGSGQNTARRSTTHVVRTHEIMGVLRPGRVATVVDAVEENGVLWTVTEWIDGIPLGELLARHGPMNPGRAARIGLELLDVLRAAHGEGITHGELSPGQVFVPERGPVVVTGFGLAGATLSPRVTAPSYASPEQARDERVGPAADLWALGAVLYTMTEGRPPFRDRGRPEATLRAVDRLPLRPPLRAGPLARTVQGLLRKDSLERLTHPVVHEALSRIRTDDDTADGNGTGAGRTEGAGRGGEAAHRPSGSGGPVRRRGSWGGRAMTAGTALAAVSVAVALLATSGRLPGTTAATSAGAATAPRPGATPGGPSGDRTNAHGPGPDGSSGTSGVPGASGSSVSPSAARSAAASPSAPSPAPSRTAPGASALPAGFRRYTAPEGFSVALPDGWRRLDTVRAADGAYRVTFGASGDPRTLAVTYSERVGPDPVAVWLEDVLPGLLRLDGFRLIGRVRATAYRDSRAADIEWFAGRGKDRTRTFGRGFLLGGGHGFSLRWTTPAADGTRTAADGLALRTFLATFRPAPG
ncbi:serine/threonine-protein kinase [Streptomyces sp. NPDC047000]|uniref:serine/threonine protein kinase n=1 Tax=Streptomyces sp. NPDC047000 TaxID=3155474 RepID=UPI0033E589E2